MNSQRRTSRRRSLRPVLVAVGLAGSSCSLVGLVTSDDAGRFGGSDDFSIEASLAELPIEAATGGSKVIIYVSDYLAATEAAGLVRPTGSVETQEVVDWIDPMVGMGSSNLYIWVPPSMRGAMTRLAEYRDEVGFSVRDIDAVAEMTVGVDSFRVVAVGLDPKGLDNEVAPGVGTIGEGADGELVLGENSAARPLGKPIRIAQQDGLVAMSFSTPAVSAWLDPDSSRLSDDEDLVLAATILDDADVVTAMLCRCVRVTPPVLDPNVLIAEDQSSRETGHISVPFATLAIGCRAVEGRAELVVVYVFENGDAAETASPQVESAYVDGVSSSRGVPISDVLVVDSVRVDGKVVVANLHFADEEPLPVSARGMFEGLEPPFTFTP